MQQHREDDVNLMTIISVSRDAFVNYLEKIWSISFNNQTALHTDVF